MVILEKHGKALTFCPSQGVQTQDIPCHPLVPKESQHQGDLLLATSWSTPRRAKPSRQLAGSEALHDWKLKIYMLNIQYCKYMWSDVKCKSWRRPKSKFQSPRLWVELGPKYNQRKKLVFQQPTHHKLSWGCEQHRPWRRTLCGVLVAASQWVQWPLRLSPST